MSPDTLRAALKALALPADNEAQIRDGRARLKKINRENEPLAVIAPGARISVGARGRVRFTGETGIVSDVAVANGFARAPAAPGYYRLDDRRIAVAPRQAWSMRDILRGEKVWGTAAQVYALRGGTTRGFGDFAALAELVTDAAAAGAQALAISPVHALFGAEPRHYSPYSPSTRFALNPLFAALPGGKTVDGSDDLIDWTAAVKRKTSALHRAFRHSRCDPGEMQEMNAFARRSGDRLLAHARFEVLDARFRKQHQVGWRNWPAPFRDSGSASVRELAPDDPDVAFQIYLQWMAYKSLATVQERAKDAGMRVGLIADMAIGTDPSGSHAWHAPDEVLNGLSVGAPPDIFNQTGQNWGITTFSPAGLAHTGYSGFIDTLRAVMANAGGIRLDHAMGLMRLWVIPDGASPADGVYLHYPLKALLGLLALELQRHRAIVIAEDLGTVPGGLRERLARARLQGMRVLWFERNAKGEFLRPAKWDPSAAALSTTHDLPTIAGWWSGRDLDWRERTSPQFDRSSEEKQRGRDRAQLWSALREARCVVGTTPSDKTPARAIAGALAFLAKTPCPLALVPLEDIEGDVEQPNLPGTIDEHPNWRRRLKTRKPFSTRDGRARADILTQGRKSSFRARPTGCNSTRTSLSQTRPSWRIIWRRSASAMSTLHRS